VPLFGTGRFDPAKEREATSLRVQLEAMDELVRAGKVREVGVSNETSWGVCALTRLAEREGLPRIASIQNVYNLMSREFEDALAETCLREEVGLLAYSPLAFGHLTGKYLEGARPPRARLTLFGERWPRYAKPRIAEAAAGYAGIARDAGLTPVQLALRFVHSRPFVACTIVGATSVDQLRQAFDACAQPALPSDVLQAIEALHDRLPNPAP
jgi:aryl-alcohol dehydrogenase (NADP+)